jgi:cellulose synthase/poly-beta-1,6-N-acetylglucosamine synthase-like glycosyltransferase
VEEQPDATVVVPTWRRSEALAGCLAALERQTIRNRLQVVVVHDGEPAANAPTMPAGVELAWTLRRGGPAAARNLGVARAAADRVLFLDDDCVPAPAWAEQLLVRLQDEQAAAGRTVGADAYSRATQLITDELMGLDALGHVAFAPTMNLGCRRALLVDVPFDDAFPTAAGEDRAWCDELGRRGIPIAFEGTAVVEHRPAPSFSSFVRQHSRYGGGSARLRSASGTVGRPRHFYRRLATRSLRAGPQAALLVATAQLAVAYGIAGGHVRALTRRRAR